MIDWICDRHGGFNVDELIGCCGYSKIIGLMSLSEGGSLAPCRNLTCKKYNDFRDTDYGCP